jgi:AcrR family transcriptional regulator
LYKRVKDDHNREERIGTDRPSNAAPAGDYAGGTRDRILSAARDLAVERGFGSFTVDKVAERAGVSRMTVYYQFGAKSQLLEALLDWIAARGGIDGLRDAFQEVDPVDALTRFIDVFCGFWASDRVGLRRLRGWMAAESDAGEPEAGRDAWRRDGLRTLLTRLHEAHGVPSPNKLEETLDVLQVLTSFESYDRLASGGRSRPEVVALLSRTALAVLGLDE